MKAIIVDDEPKAIELLKGYLQHFKSIELKKTFRNGLKAIEYLSEEQIDLIFLDINMPHISGISLSKMIPHRTKVIFTTAHSEFAVESYEVDTVDYLLKPISLERFTKALSKALPNQSSQSSTGSKILLLKSGQENHRVVADEINYMEKDGNYMIYHLNDKKILVRETVSNALNRLPDNFLQIYRSYIINTEKIESFDRETIKIRGKSLPIGASFKGNVLTTIESN